MHYGFCYSSLRVLHHPSPCCSRSIQRNFARHILFGEPLISPGEEGLRSLELANAIWLSAHTQQPVALPISREAYNAFLAEKRLTSTYVKQTVEVQRTTDPHHV